MTLIETAPVQPLTPEQVYEIRTMAEGGQFADALIRLRKIKSMYPRSTFIVALEKQLERLLVLPRDTDPSDPQRKELVDSLPGLIHGAVESMRNQRPVSAPVSEPPKPRPERIDREAARAQLKEQYFQHADEYLKKGAYGSALVEIRRVKIIAPDDQTAVEYERTIRQLVELQQRTGLRPQEHAGAPGGSETTEPISTVAEDAPPVLEYPHDEPQVPRAQANVLPPDHPPQKRARNIVLALIGLVVVLGIAGTVIEFAPESQGVAAVAPRQTVPAASVSPLNEQHPVVTQEPQHVADLVPAMEDQPAVTKPDFVEKAKQDIVQPAGNVHAMIKMPERVPDTKQSLPAEEKKEEGQGQTPSERDPQIVRLEQPEFTAEALGASGSAEVIIMVQINQDGTPVKSLVAKSTNPAFNQAVTAAVMKSTYRAGTTGDQPATKWITIPFRVK